MNDDMFLQPVHYLYSSFRKTCISHYILLLSFSLILGGDLRKDLESNSSCSKLDPLFLKLSSTHMSKDLWVFYINFLIQLWSFYCYKLCYLNWWNCAVPKYVYSSVLVPSIPFLKSPETESEINIWHHKYRKIGKWPNVFVI